MNPDEATTREKVLRAAVRLLSKSAPEKLTIRQITAQAGVNAAAINYHFRSKENLVDEAVFAFSQQAFASGMKILRDAGLPPGERLLRFFKGYAFGLVEFRGATMAAFAGVMNARGAEGRYAGMMRELFAAVMGNVKELADCRDAREQARKALMLFSGVVFPFLCLELFLKAGGIDYRDRAARDRYIEMLVRALRSDKE
jgi:AcrR family transcriptional regulator